MLGETNYNKFGSKMTIIKYQNNKNVTIQFDDGYVITTEYQHFKKGSIKNPYDKIVYNIGYFGEGSYKGSIKGKHTKEYVAWTNMLKRCYELEYTNKHSTYKDCIVCEEWHNFQNFAHWYNDHYYKINEQEMALDKDILHKGNKIYSPNNCVFVPQNINKLFTKSDSARGEFPLGVSFKKNNNKYFAQIRKRNKNVFLGYFNSCDQAFNIYKLYKEEYIKQIADEYKNKIPKILYDAMYSYIVEITD